MPKKAGIFKARAQPTRRAAVLLEIEAATASIESPTPVTRVTHAIIDRVNHPLRSSSNSQMCRGATSWVRYGSSVIGPRCAIPSLYHHPRATAEAVRQNTTPNHQIAVIEGLF